MKRLWQVEAALVRVESGLMIGLVLLMLALAGYNVLFRNVLVPLQLHWAHSGPPITEAATPSADASADTSGAARAPAGELAAPEPAGAEGFGGFGEAEPAGEGKEAADFGAEDEPKADPGAKAGDEFGGFGDEPAKGEGDEVGGLGDEPKKPAKGEGDEFGGFGDEPAKGERDEFGGLGDEPKKPAKGEGDEFGGFGDEPKKPAKAEGDEFGGFADEPKKNDPANAEGEDFGGFGDEPKDEPAKAEGEDFGGFGDAAEGEAAEPAAADEFGPSAEDDLFANLDEFEGPTEAGEAGPVGGPPPEGSFAAWAVAAIEVIKIDWIDVFLRQLVVIVGFLGAAVATQRGRHINVDAVSRLLSAGGRRWAAVATNLLAVGVCGVLAWSGKRLVDIGRAYPNEVLPFIEEWMLQLMFPIGFALLVFHFSIRTLEALTGNVPPDEAPVATEEAAR